MYAVSEHMAWAAHGYDDVPYALWPHRHDVFRGPFRHSPKSPSMLVIGGTHDPATPYSWAKRYVAQLGNARLLTYESDGHGAITDLNPCVFVTAAVYIETLELPAEGTVCEQNVDPFPTGAAARRAGGVRWTPPQAPLVPELG